MATTCKLIAKNVLGSDTGSVTFSSIPATFDDLWVVASVRSTRSSTVGNGRVYLNSTSNLSQRVLRAFTSTPDSYGGTTTEGWDYFTPAASSTANTFGITDLYVPNYAGSTNKSVSITSSYSSNSSSDYNYANVAVAGLWADTSAVTSITWTMRSADSANIAAGSSFYLFGITKA